MPTGIGEDIEKGSEGLAKLAQPSIFAAVMCLLMLGGFSIMMWYFRQDWREERIAYVEVMKEIRDELKHMDKRLMRLESTKGIRNAKDTEEE